MEKKEIAERLAESAKMPTAEAADELDTVIHNVLKRLRNHRERPRANALQRLIEEARPASDAKGRHAR